MREIHKIQRELLLKLLFSQRLKFTDLKIDPAMGNSQFVFHLDVLRESGYVGVKREMKEETNLKGDPKLVHIRHYINKDRDTGAVIEDKFLYLFVVNNPTGELTQNNEAKFEWVHRRDFRTKVSKPFDSFEEREVFPQNF